MANYKEVVEMLGENLASLLELVKKWLIEWSIDSKKILHQFHQIKKEDLIGLIAGTHQILPMVEKWKERNGIIYFSVTSDGTTGEQWIARLEGKGYQVGYWAKSLLKSADFKPTNGVTTEVAILRGMLFTDDNRITSKIRAEGTNRKFETPNAEISCLIREKFTDEEIEAMGLVWIVVMHEPIKDSDGDPRLLGADRLDGGHWFRAYGCLPDDRWLFREEGFAFSVSQVSPNN